MAFLAKIKGWLIAVGAGIVTLLTVFFWGRANGKKEQEVKQTKEVLNEVKKAKNVSASAVSRDTAAKLSKRYSHK